MARQPGWVVGKKPCPSRMQMQGRRWSKSPRPHILSGTSRTNVIRNHLGILSCALMEEGDQMAWGAYSPIFIGFLLWSPASPPYLARGTHSLTLLCSSPRKRHGLYLFWYIAVGSFNLCNRLREDFIQWGESNYHFICNQLPSHGLHLSELEGPVSPCTCLDSFFFLWDRFMPLTNASIDTQGFQPLFKAIFLLPAAIAFIWQHTPCMKKTTGYNPRLKGL